MQKLSTKKRALLELVTAGIFWGFGFTATVWALQGIGPSAIIFYRFFAAFVVSIFILKIKGHSIRSLKREAKIAFIPGVMLGATLLFQSFGLQWTTATKSSFITTLYVIIVPFLARFSHREKIPFAHWISVLVALLGVVLIVQLKELSLERGDLLTLVCAFFAAVHILVVDFAAHKSHNHFALNAFQSLWCALCAIPLAFIDHRWNLNNLQMTGWIGLTVLAFGNSLFAFYLQFKSQKYLSPSLASLLFLLESPFSALFAIAFLKESLTGLQSLGALLIFAACAYASQLQGGTSAENKTINAKARTV